MNEIEEISQLEYTEADELYCGDSWINDLTRDTIIENTTFERLLQIADPMERKRMIAKVTFRASDLRCTNKFKELLKEYQMQRAKQQPRELAKGHELTDFAELGLGDLLLDCGAWNVSESGVYKVSVDSNGNQKTVQASPIPIAPTMLISDVETGDELVKISYVRDYKEYSIKCARSDIADKGKIVKLSDKGVPVTSSTAKALVDYLNDCINLNTQYIPKGRVANHLGWCDGLFVGYPPNEIEFYGSPQLKHLLSCSGDVSVWRDCICECIEKSVEFRIFMAAAFASPLLERIGAQSFIVHLWGHTGSGKSVALMAANSIYGEPAGELFISMNNTINFMQVRAAGLRNLPFCADELQTIKDNRGKGSFVNYDGFIMQMCEGVERGALNRDRTEKATREWYNVFLTTGEEPIVKPNSGAGAYNRVLQLPINGNIFSDFAKVVDTVKNNYGYAGAIFITELIKKPGLMDKAKKDYRRYCMQYSKKGITGKQAAILAALKAADNIANELIYASSKELRDVDLLSYAVSDKEINTSDRAKEYILNKIAMHNNDFIGVYEDPETGEINESNGHQPTGRIFGKITKEKTTKEDVVYINKSVLIEWLEEANFDFDAVKGGWADSGFLIKNSAGRFNCNPPKGLTGTYVKLKLH